MTPWLPGVGGDGDFPVRPQREISLPTFDGVTSRSVVPAWLTPAHGCSAGIDLAGGVDPAGGGGALAGHPGDQECQQEGPDRHSTHPSEIPANY